MPRISNHEASLPGRAVAGSAAAIDHAVLDNLLSNDQEAVGTVLRQFLASCAGDASALGVALAGSDGKGALRWAHRLKGACQLVGAQSLADACTRAEVAVKAGDAGLIAQAAVDVAREAARVMGYLETWLNASR